MADPEIQTRLDLSGLSKKQQRALFGLLECETQQGAAVMAGCDRSTIARYLKRPDFLAIYQAAKADPALLNGSDIHSDFELLTDIVAEAAKAEFSDVFKEGTEFPLPPSEWPRRAKLAMVGGAYSFSRTTEELDEKGKVVSRTTEGCSIRFPARKDNFDRVFQSRMFMNKKEDQWMTETIRQLGGPDKKDKKMQLKPGQEVMK